MAEAPVQSFNLSAAEVVNKLKTDLQKGLSSGQARRLLEQFGPNELPEEAPTPFWKRFLEQFQDFLVIILLVAAAISVGIAMLRPWGGGAEYIDAAAILGIVLINAILGVVQESKAENALRALRRMAAPGAQVLRDGHLTNVPARELVPGDVVLLEAGNYVPADLRLAESANLRIEEAALTGESVPVEKDAGKVLAGQVPTGDRINCAFMGTVVAYGRGTGLVTETGLGTQLGRIAEMLRTQEAKQTPLQAKLNQLGKWLGYGCLAICAVVFGVGLLRGQHLLEMFLTAVSLAIAAVPEGLPAVVTVCLALGTQRMLRRHALIRNLPAVETLGSATVICSDKTGTLTQNEMTVVRLWAGGRSYTVEGRGYQPVGRLETDGRPASLEEAPELAGALLGGALCSDARLERQEGGRYRMVGDPTEGAMVVAAAKAGLWRHEQEQALPRVDEVPFDSVRKRMSTVHAWAESSSGHRPFAHASPYMAFTKGATDLVLERCSHILEHGTRRPLSAADRRAVMQANDAMADQALRVLAVACRPLTAASRRLEAEELETDLTLLGLQGMMDPPRPEVRSAVQTARRAGIKTIMITGDHKRTAHAIAGELGMFTPGPGGLTGVELESMSDEQFARLAPELDVYSRVSPQHKVRIVDTLKAQGHIVAMTGDGVNDAPAVKRADIGVAMGITGTDVAKEAADMVLTDDNYASIVSAIEEGRVIFANIRKFVYYLLSCNVGEILIVFVAATLGLPALPFLPIHLLMLNLVTDGLPALALGMEAPEPGVMDRPPRRPGEPIVTGPMWWGIGVQALLDTASTLAAFLIALYLFPGPVDAGKIVAAQTLAFTTLVLSELFRAFTCRSERVPVWRQGLASNRNMVWAFLSSMGVMLAIIYVPFLDPIFHTTFLEWRHWALIVPLALPASIGAEAVKAAMRARDRRKAAAA
jgi:Ca2+-transporting ATPase